jgi:hypothetical protein
MFAFVITCPACGYESDSFAEGLDIHEKTFTVLFMKTSDRTFRVDVVDEYKMKTYGGDLDSGMGVDAAIRALAAPGEERINLPLIRCSGILPRFRIFSLPQTTAVLEPVHSLHFGILRRLVIMAIYYLARPLIGNQCQIQKTLT